ncbi:MAG: DHH family phosphoesterase [Gaiellales bacterium]
MSGLADVAELLRTHPRVVVACHEAPDGDALGSLIGCGSALRAGGWDVVLWAPGDAPLPADYGWLGYGELVREAPADIAERLLLALDCGSAQRLGAGGETAVAAAAASANVDHHADNTRFAQVNVVDADAACATVLCLRLLRLLELPLSAAVAEALYVGIVTDTGRFMFGNTDAEAHVAAADLIAFGVAPDAVFRRLYEGKPEARVRLLARALSSLDVRADGRLAVACITLGDLDATGAAEEDSEGVIDHLRAIRGVDVAAVIREPRAGGGTLKKASLRSTRPEVDVARIAHVGGGGGHAMAAGFAMEGSFADVIALIEGELARG